MKLIFKTKWLAAVAAAFVVFLMTTHAHASTQSPDVLVLTISPLTITTVAQPTLVDPSLTGQALQDAVTAATQNVTPISVTLTNKDTDDSSPVNIAHVAASSDLQLWAKNLITGDWLDVNTAGYGDQASGFVLPAGTSSPTINIYPISDAAATYNANIQVVSIGTSNLEPNENVAITVTAPIVVPLATTALVHDEAELNAALADTNITTITFANDIPVAAEVVVSRAVTIDGAGNTISPTFDYTSNSNNTPLGVVAATGNVTIKDLKEDGAGHLNLHGMVIFNSTNVNLNNITVSNNAKNGLSINGSTVIVTGITTSNNTWGGIDVDNPNATLTIHGPVSQTETAADIFKDVKSDATIVVNDPDGLYTSADFTNNGVEGTLYTLKPITVPVTTTGGGSTAGITSGGGGIPFTGTGASAVTAPAGQVLGAESFHFTLSLKMGAKGDEVTQLQTRLNADGATPALVVDGKFGAKTKTALIKWQKAHKLTADGKLGTKTIAALNA